MTERSPRRGGVPAARRGPVAPAGGARPLRAPGLLAGLLALAAFGFGASAQAQTVEEYVANNGNSNQSTYPVGQETSASRKRQAVSFKTGLHPNGYGLHSITAIFWGAIGSSINPLVTIHEDDSGSPGDLVVTLNNPATVTGTGGKRFTVDDSDHARLAADTQYWVVFGSAAGSRNGASYVYNLRATEEKTQDSPAGDDDWEIGNNRLHQTNDDAWQTDTDEVLKLRVWASTRHDATGRPEITHTAVTDFPAPGEVLSANSGSIADANGITKAEAGDAGFAYTYQWLRDAVPIDNASTSIYTVREDDWSSRITVQASFKDDVGTPELRTSRAITAACVEDTARLVEGNARGEGSVQYCHDTEWRSVCDDSWAFSSVGHGRENATVACKQAGFPLGAVDNDARAVTLGSFFDDSPGATFWLDDVMCEGNEDSLANCMRNDFGVNDCSSSERVGVRCKVGDGNATLSALGLFGADGEAVRISPAFDPETYDYTADVINRFATVTVSSTASSTGATVKYLDGDDMALTDADGGVGGFQIDLAVGNNRIKAEVTSEDLSVVLTYEINAVRRTSGNSSATGTPTILPSPARREGNTLEASTAGITDRDGLQYVTFSYQWLRTASNPAAAVEIDDATGPEYPLTADDVGMRILVRVDFTDDGGHPESLTSAPTEAVVARVTNTCEADAVRLVGSEDEMEGSVQICHNNQWGHVCDDMWDRQNANVACRAAGFPAGARQATTRSTFVSTDRVRYWLDDVNCVGNEDSLADCMHLGWGVNDCRFSERAGVRCDTTDAKGRPTITGQPHPLERLTAGRDDITDLDGLTNASSTNGFTYTWVRVHTNYEEDITGANNRNYTLTADDLGWQVKVRVAFTDDNGNPEAVTSRAYPPDSVVTERRSLVTGLLATQSDTATVGTTPGSATTTIQAQRFRTGTSTDGYLFTSAGAWLRDYDGDETVEVSLFDAGTGADPDPSRRLERLTNPAAVRDRAINQFTSPGVALEPDQFYFIVFEEGSPQVDEKSYGVRVTPLATTTLDAIDEQWRIGSDRHVSEDDRATWVVEDWAVLIQVSGGVIPPPNNAPEFPNARYTRSAVESLGTSVTNATSTPVNVGAPVTAEDADDGGGLTYSLDGPDASSFTIGVTSGQIQTRGGMVYDFEEQPSYLLTVVADDGQGGRGTAEVTVALRDRLERPLAPTGVVAMTSTFHHTVLDVNWTAPAPDGRPPVTAYRVEYRLTSDAFTPVLGELDVTGTSATIGRLMAETEYDVRVYARNADGFGPASATSTARTATTRNADATGKPEILGAPQLGELLWVNRNRIRDLEGLDTASTTDSWTYQWFRDTGSVDEPIESATTSAYTVTPEDTGQRLKVAVGFVDDAGKAEAVVSDGYPARGYPASAIKVLDAIPACGFGSDFCTELRVGVAEDELGSRFGRAADINGGSFSGTRVIHPGGTPEEYNLFYFHLSVETEGAFVNLQLEDHHLPLNTDVGLLEARMKVTEASRTETPGLHRWPVPDNFVIVEGAALPLTINFPQPATGEPGITGAAFVGATLTANPGTIDDPDGISNATSTDAFTYQWYQLDRSVSTPIAGATGKEYMLAPEDVGKQIQVRASFVDDADNPESRLSAGYPEDGTVLEAANFLVSNIDQTATTTFPVGEVGSTEHQQAQRFNTGTSTDGYIITGVVAVLTGVDVNDEVQVSLHAADRENSSAVPAERLAVLDNPDRFFSGFNWFPAPNVALAANTAYFVVFSAPQGAYDVSATGSLDEDVTPGTTNWDIQDFQHQLEGPPLVWDPSGTSVSPLRILVTGGERTAPDLRAPPVNQVNITATATPAILHGSSDKARFVLERVGPTDDALTVSVMLSQSRRYLNDASLSRDVTIGAGNRTAVFEVNASTLRDFQVGEQVEGGWIRATVLDGELLHVAGDQASAQVDVLAVTYGLLEREVTVEEKDLWNTYGIVSRLYGLPSDASVPGDLPDSLANTAFISVLSRAGTAISAGSLTGGVWSGDTEGDPVGDYAATSVMVSTRKADYRWNAGAFEAVTTMRQRLRFDLQEGQRDEGDEMFELAMQTSPGSPPHNIYAWRDGAVCIINDRGPQGCASSVTIKDTPRPRVTGVSIESSPAFGPETYGAGERIRAAVHFDRPMTFDISTASTTPTMEMEVGTDNIVSMRYAGQAGPAAAFEYEVQSGDRDTDGVSLYTAGGTPPDPYELALVWNGAIVRGTDGIDALPGAVVPGDGHFSRHKVDGSESAEGVLVANVRQVRDLEEFTGIFAQGFRTGTEAAGYVVDTVAVHLSSCLGNACGLDDTVVSIHRDVAGLPADDDVEAVLSVPISLQSGTASSTLVRFGGADDPPILAPDTGYHVVYRKLSSGLTVPWNVHFTREAAEDPESQPGWTIDDRIRQLREDGWDVLEGRSAIIEVRGSATTTPPDTDEAPVDTSLPTLTLEQDPTVSEGDGTIGFTVFLDPATGTPVEVRYSTSIESGDTASADDFIEEIAKLLTIPSNATQAEIPVVIIDDDVDEQIAETFTLSIAPVTARIQLGDPSSSQATIFDDDSNASTTDPSTGTTTATTTATTTNFSARATDLIVGVPQVGKLLTASTTDIKDANGLTGAVFQTSWYRRHASNELTFTGVTGGTYEAGPLDLDHEIALLVEFTDDEGFAEQVFAETDLPVVPAAADCPPASVWCTTMTSGRHGSTVVGYATSTPSNTRYGHLEQDTFTYKDAQYQVTFLSVPGASSLQFATDPLLPAGGDGLTLHIQRLSGTLDLPLSEANRESFSSIDDTWIFPGVTDQVADNPPLLRSLSRNHGRYTLPTASGTELMVRLSTASTTATGTPPTFPTTSTTRSFTETVGVTSEASRDIGAPVAADDPDRDETYFLAGPDAALFDIDTETGQLSTQTSRVYDYEDRSRYDVVVRALDTGGRSAEIDVAILVTNVLEPPLRVAAPSVTTVPEGLRVNWTPPDDSGRPSVVSYWLRYRTDGDWTVIPTGSSDTERILTGLMADTTYQVQAAAANADGAGPYSPSGHGTTGEGPPVSSAFFGRSEYPAYEGGADAQVTVNLSPAPASQVVLPLTATRRGGASAADYSGIPASLTFNAGDSSKSFSVTATDDAVDDDGESVDIGFGALPSGTEAGTRSTTTVRLVDDDDSLWVAFDASTYTATEGGPGAQVRVTMTPPPAGTTVVPLTAAGEGGANSSDYSGVPPSVTFRAGETSRDFTVTAADDGVNESGESVRLGFGSLPSGVNAGSPASARVNLADAPASLSVRFDSAETYVREGIGRATVELLLNQAPGRALTIPITVTYEGGATAADHTDIPASLTFGVGDTSASFKVGAVVDEVDDDGEQLRFGFGTLPEGVTTAEPTSKAVSLVDQSRYDLEVSFLEGEFTIHEHGGTVRVQVGLNERARETVTIPLKVTHRGGATPDDYTGVPASVTINKGDRLRTFDVKAVNDELDDDGESIVIGLGTLPFGYVPGYFHTQVIHINDNDGRATWEVWWESQSYTAEEGGSSARVTARLEAPWKPWLNEPLAIRIGWDHLGGATRRDYSGIPDPLVFPVGETSTTFTVTATADDEAESGESVEIWFPAPDERFSPREVVRRHDRDEWSTRVHLVDFGEDVPMIMVAGTMLTVRYPEPLDAGSTPSGTDFVVTADSAEARATLPVTSVAVAGTDAVLTLARPVTPEETVTLSYLRAPMHPLQNPKGEPLPPLTEMAVRNETPADGGATDPGKPEIRILAAHGAEAPDPALAVALRARPDALGRVDLSNLDLATLEALAGLRSVRELNLEGNAIADLGALQDLVGLQVLDLSDNRVGGLWPLAGLTGLKRLDLSNNRVVDLAPLASLQGLEVLLLNGNDIANVLPLALLPGLVNLGLADNRIADTGLLAELPMLVRLDLAGNRVADLGPLGDLSELVWLRLPGNPVLDAAPLGRLTVLRWLWLDPETPGIEAFPMDAGPARARVLRIDSGQ